MGLNRSDEDFRADHYRDHAKHEPRASDPLPSRLSPPIATALDIAFLVKGLNNIRDAEKLIEQYAQTVASGAVLDAVTEAGNRIIASIEAPLVRT